MISFPLWLSFKVAFIASAIVLTVGLSLIGVATRLGSRSRDVLRVITSIPLVLSPTVVGYYLFVVMSRGSGPGALFRNLFGFDLVFTWQAAVLASVIASFPLFFMTALPAFESIDKSIINAARTLGKSEIQIFWLIKLPLAWRGILSGISLAFARALGEFGITLMIAGNIPGKTQTAPLAIYDFVITGNRAGANSLALITTVFGISLLLVGLWLVQRRAYKL